ncbi:hypothetical protein H2200_013331 [Cladophialophora chaetospira]|uniref:Uncharacterized protein n=1 Tax=Cladophialophora chaetospira TaxID=386627 RepID=A0AA39CBC5_9EURO|nr:hypothetical protein H2200_013331 [Cladophialophora chaetospira]
MTKLTKAPPPAYPGGKSSPPGSLDAAVPYENMRQSTQPPVPVTTAVLPSSYNDPLPDTNPFSPNFKPDTTSDNAQSFPFDPVSPDADSEPVTRSSEAPVQAPKPHRPAEQRKSADLRRLDGKPYPNSNGAPEKEKPKKVRVAKDMFDGALPPMYEPSATSPAAPTENPTAASKSQGCGKCGKNRDGHGKGHSCTHCGKRRTAITDPTGAPPAPRASAAHSRAASESRQSHKSSRISQQSTAGPSSTPNSPPHPRTCNRCGRLKRPTAPMPMGGHPAMRPGLSIKPDVSGYNAAYPQIDVIPPSATTYKAMSSRFSQYGDESPLVGQAKKEDFKLFRNSSLVRSLSRRLSKKDKQTASPAPLPSQQLARQSGEQSAGNLISMISTAMQDRDGQYAKLENDRPETPFSFVAGKDETDGFEMIDLRGDRTSVSSHDSCFKEPAAPRISVTHSESDLIAAVSQDEIDIIDRPRSTGPQHLTVEDSDRPPITRFKSLRQSVHDVGDGISRSTSLKRLGSLKTVHHAWYLEGSDGNNENIIPAF